MKNYILLLNVLIFGATFFNSCSKDDDSPSVNITFTESGKYIGSDTTVNQGDSLFFKWNLSSTVKMGLFNFAQNSTGLTGWNNITLAASKVYSFAGSDTIIAGIPGDYTFAITVYDSTNYRLTSKSVKVTVRPDYSFYSNCQLFIDTTTNSQPVFFSTSTGAAFSLTSVNQSANYDKIDFGYYGSVGSSSVAHTLFAPSNSPKFDLSSWTTQNATQFKNFYNTSLSKITLTDFTSLNSYAAIESAWVNSSKLVTTTIGSTVKIYGIGNIIGFQTADGRHGFIYIKNIYNYSGKNYIIFHVKVQNKK